MISKIWIQKALSLCLLITVYATYSMTALAASDKLIGELTVSGQSINGETASVLVNGEAAQTGRSVFSSSTIATPENASAIINIAKVGKVELAPKTTLALSFTENGVTGDLLAGKVTVLGAAASVNITTPNGQVANLKAGQSATVGQTQQDDDDDDTSVGGGNWLIYAAIFGGAIAAIAIAATSDNNRVQVGGSSTVVSPIR